MVASIDVLSVVRKSFLINYNSFRRTQMIGLTIQVRFIIMGNLLCSEYTIHRRFDLKGSSLGRITEKPESEMDDTTILEDLDLNFIDLDLNFIFKLQKAWFQEFCR